MSLLSHPTALPLCRRPRRRPPRAAAAAALWPSPPPARPQAAAPSRRSLPWKQQQQITLKQRTCTATTYFEVLNLDSTAASGPVGDEEGPAVPGCDERRRDQHVVRVRAALDPGHRPAAHRVCSIRSHGQAGCKPRREGVSQTRPEHGQSRQRAEQSRRRAPN